MVTIHTDVQQGSETWLQARDGKYTGTSAHKLLKYGKIEYATTISSDFKGTFWTKRGGILEEEVIGLYETIRHCTVDRPGYVTNSEFPDCLYSPDGICGDTLIEVKCFKQEKHLSIYNGEPPLEVKAQIHFGMLITELKKACLLIYNPELDPKLAFKIIDIPYNQNIQNNFKRILGKEVVHV